MTLRDDETIVALATAPGRSALALIRLSGAQAMTIARALGVSDLIDRRATRVRLQHPMTGEPLDDALVTWFAAPRSFTGEAVVEISTHGGAVVPAQVVAACVAAGARPADPGEFTWRAVRNGRLDLLQAEAIGDLIDARTVAAQQQALQALDGGLSRRLLALREAVIELEALLAYDVDFPGEDDGPIPMARIVAATDSLVQSLRRLLATAPRASARRDGVLVVIAGPPNAGKSSLFNALLGESRAIVTPTAGTTRDAIEALLDRTPWPLRLVDTAGVRETADAIEQLGIEVSQRYLAQATLVLACGASDDELAHTLTVVALHTPGRIIPVRTKRDLLVSTQSPDHGGSVASPLADDPAGFPPPIAVSAETGDGLDALLQAIDAVVEQTLHGDAVTASADAVITRERHRAGVQRALEEVEAFQQLCGTLPTPIAASYLLTARDALSELIGTVETEEILGRVFSSFCIGK